MTGISVVLVSLTLSHQVRSETIEQAVAAALQKHPTLDQAVAAQQAAREGVVEERSGYFPKLSASTAAGRVYGNNATSRGLSVTRGAGYSWMWEGSLNVNQMLFDGLRTQRMVGSAKAREGAAAASLRDMRETLALQTALSYLNVLRTRESQATIEGYLGTLDDYRNRIGAMVREGAADEAELQQAEEVRLEVQNLIASFKGQVQSASAEYAKLTGHLPVEKLARPEDVSQDLPASADEAIKLVWTSHPQVAKSNQDIIASGFAADAEKSALYPTVTGELSAYAKDVDDLIGGEVEDNRALVRATWNFSTGGAELARIRKAKQDYIQTKGRKAETLRNLEAAIRVAYADLETSAMQKNILAERLAADQKLMQTYNVQFEGGKVRILQLLQGESQLLNAKLDLMNADYRHIAAQYSVLGSMGRLQEQLSTASPVAKNAKH
jgi:adhesin transport system outer membrane protein